MEGRIYISGAFSSLCNNNCKSIGPTPDNDPHFYNSPPTWGICRTDFRKKLKKGDYVFFVLPKNAIDENKLHLPQMIYGYFKIEQHIDHITAYQLFPQKRMRAEHPNGNIIVNADGSYNQFDNGAHLEKFNQIKEHYIIGSQLENRFLQPQDVIRLAPSFLDVLNEVFEANFTDIFKIIGRKGRIINEMQIQQLLHWINE